VNWDDLKIFLAVARQQKLAAAARSLGVDATTISRRIDRLAADLGTPLFEQSSGGHLLTAGGTELLRHAEEIERSALAARADVTGERGLLSGIVRVSVAEGFGTWIVARHLAAFRSANPDIVVELIASSGFLNPSKREADLAVMLARPTSGPLVARRLTDYSLQLYATREYLDRAPPLQTAKDLRRHVLIGYVPDLIYSPALDYIAEIRPGSAPDIRSSSINAQHALTVSGAGLCVLPRFIGAQDARLVPVLTEEIALTRSFWLVVHRDTRQLARVAAFVDWLVVLIASQSLVLASPGVPHDRRG
jgi:DNA-binding transcriptional LysR family regulator